MEDSGVESSPPKLHTPQPQQPQLGLGFQSNDPSPPPPNDLDTQNPNKQELQNQQTMSEEQENEYLQAINEEFKNLVLGEKEKENDKGFSESEEESTDREVHGGETVLMVDEREEDENEMRYRKYHNYPVRPGAEDCSYYMRNGSCKFGANCKFNHPTRRKNQATKEKVKESEENPERPGQTECKYYLRSGGCKYGKACRYNHSRGKTAVAPIAEFNFLGLPIRPGEKECPFYMRNGSCKYGSNCRFNHPDPTAVGGSDIPSGYSNGGSVPLQGASQSTMSSWSSPRALNGTGPFVPVMYPPNQGVPSSNSEWNGYQAPVFPTTESGLPMPPAFALNIPAETNFYANDHKQQMLVDEFPERPGQPECTYFLKTGYCKYRSGCKFHHPKHRMQKPAAFSDKGLPLRPDQNICSHYTRYGICKFGPACKFDHPVNFSHSGSAAGSGPDKPSPFGNSAAADGAQMDGWAADGAQMDGWAWE